LSRLRLEETSSSWVYIRYKFILLALEDLPSWGLRSSVLFDSTWP
jgi:hypothetical protein